MVVVVDVVDLCQECKHMLKRVDQSVTYVVVVDMVDVADLKVPYSCCVDLQSYMLLTWLKSWLLKKSYSMLL